MTQPQKVLFICLGNTCRSPIAEAIFKQLVKERHLESYWEADSAGIADWHVGSLPNPRAQLVLQKHNIPFNHISTQIKKEHFEEFDWIFGMDSYNMRYLYEASQSLPNCKAKIVLLGSFDPEHMLEIRDPFADKGMDGFNSCYKQCCRCLTEFLNQQHKQN